MTKFEAVMAMVEVYETAGKSLQGNSVKTVDSAGTAYVEMAKAIRKSLAEADE